MKIKSDKTKHSDRNTKTKHTSEGRELLRELNNTLELLIVFAIVLESWPVRLAMIVALILVRERSSNRCINR
jgi:hypothetical protein